ASDRHHEVLPASEALRNRTECHTRQSAGTCFLQDLWIQRQAANRADGRLETRVTGVDLPAILVEPPGPESRRLAAELQRYESRDVTYVSDEWPIFLARGAGSNLQDVDGNVYVDLSAAFAVAAVGHSNPRVVAAVAEQAARLLHGMGDVYPTKEKVALARELCALALGPGSKRVIFGVSGADAVEAAL